LEKKNNTDKVFFLQDIVYLVKIATFIFTLTPFIIFFIAKRKKKWLQASAAIPFM